MTIDQKIEMLRMMERHCSDAHALQRKLEAAKMALASAMGVSARLMRNEGIFVGGERGD